MSKDGLKQWHRKARHRVCKFTRRAEKGVRTFYNRGETPRIGQVPSQYIETRLDFVTLTLELYGPGDYDIMGRRGVPYSPGNVPKKYARVHIRELDDGGHIFSMMPTPYLKRRFWFREGREGTLSGRLNVDGEI